MANGNSEFLTYAEASQFLSVPVGTLYYWVYEKRIPHHRLSSRMVRFRRSELETWLNQLQVRPDNQAVEANNNDEVSA